MLVTSTAQAFMDHSGKDEFGNLVLLFEDKQIKMAIDDGGEVFLSYDDIEKMFQYGKTNWPRRISQSEIKMIKFDKGLYHAKGKFVLAGAIPRMFRKGYSIDRDQFVELIKSIMPKTECDEADGIGSPPWDCSPSRENIEYRIIEGYPGYCVASDGSVWSQKKGEWNQICQTINKDGYYKVNIQKPANENTAGSSELVHRLVLMGFKGFPQKGEVSLHGNGIKTDNRPDNLRWGTDLENARDAVRHRCEKMSSDADG